MLENTEYTHLLFSEPVTKVDLNSNNNHQFDVKATRNIEKHEIILVEHILQGSSVLIGNLVRVNEKLYNNLYPRDVNPWTKDTIYDIKDISIVDEKVISNLFQKNPGEDILALGNNISLLNHSCNPNACIATRPLVHKTHMTIEGVIMAVYAVRRIAKDDSVCISYSPETAHEFELYDDSKRGFVCECSKTLEERINIHTTLLEFYDTYKDATLEKLIQEYARSTIYYTIKMRQFLAKDGLYLLNAKESVMAPRWIKKMKELYPAKSIVDASKHHKVVLSKSNINLY